MSDPAADIFRQHLQVWSSANPRPFPWRTASEPFAILLSEVMLRRTRADQVAPVFERFIRRFPDPASLAAADPAEVEALVRPLGLAWRVPAFQQIARALLGQHGGRVPSDPAALQSLPGVGDYVSAAVRIFAFNMPATLADTNTVRVAARYFGFPYHAESRRRRAARVQTERLIAPVHPRDSARALLDFAALVCRGVRPRCEACPVARGCAFYQSRPESSVGGAA